MRLTLRTLLAYMDEILESGDREELAKKVEGSEFANELIHRTKDTMRRLRLSAPQVIGTGIALDPNTVAEYLDNVLPPDSVADFERICLESDVHLAEVASAHHVLTMVLGEPADVDPAARQRMYGIPAEAEARKHLRIESAHAMPPAAHDLGKAHDFGKVSPAPHVYPPTYAAPAAVSETDEVPDYLRASSWTRHGTLLAACAAVLVAAVGWLIYASLPGWSTSAQVSPAAKNSNDIASSLQPPASPPPPGEGEIISETAESALAAGAAEAGAAEAGVASSLPAADAPPIQLPSESAAGDAVATAAAAPTEPAATASAPAMGAAPVMALPAMTNQPPIANTAPAAAPTTEPAAAPTVTVDESAYGYGNATPAETAMTGPPATTGPPAMTGPAATPPEAAAPVPRAVETPLAGDPATAESQGIAPAGPGPAAESLGAPGSEAARVSGANHPGAMMSAAGSGPATGAVPPTEAGPPAGAGLPADGTPPAVAPPIAEASTAAAQPAAETAAVEQAAPVEPSAPAEPIEVGAYLDGKNLVARFDAETGAWFRLPARATLHPGDKLLALPSYYPKLTLATGLHVKLAGGSLVELDAAEGASEPVLKVNYGKVVISNISNDENSFRLILAGEPAEVRLARNATLALEVTPKFVPGQDPRKAASPAMVSLYTRDGAVTWNDAVGEQQISAGSHWTIDGGSPSAVAAAGNLPDWIDEEPFEQRSEKLFGAPAVEAALNPARPVGEQLLELYTSSTRREVKSLAARSSVYVGLFVPFIEALRDSDQKSSWAAHIDTLRTAMSLGPESAEKIYQTLVDQRGKPAADDLYAMLCGYGPEQVGTAEEFRGGLAIELVDRMESDSLDYRVLAVRAMDDITGKRLMANPAGTPTERARGIRLWRQRLKAGDIVPLAPVAAGGT